MWHRVGEGGGSPGDGTVWWLVVLTPACWSPESVLQHRAGPQPGTARPRGLPGWHWRTCIPTSGQLMLLLLWEVHLGELLVEARVCRHSHVHLCDPVDCSPPGSSVYGISQAGYWSGLPFPTPGDRPHPEIERISLLCLLHWQADFFLPLCHLGSP